MGFVRVAVGSHRVEVTNTSYNADRIIAMMKRGQEVQANFLILNELGTTAYSCANHFRSEVVRQGALDAIERVRKASVTDFDGITIIGAPIEVDGQLFNCAVVIQRGNILGIVPKTYLPNYGEFHEKLWFTRGDILRKRTIVLNGRKVRIGVDLLFQALDFPGLIFGVEVCEDGWAVIPPHRLQVLAGATMNFNLSASNELVAKDEYRRNLVGSHSAQAQTIYAYASAGDGESTNDVVYGGHLLIGELGSIMTEAEPLSESEPFRYSDVDVQHVVHERMRDGTFQDCQRDFASMLDFDRITFYLRAGSLPKKLARRIDAYPFVPQDPASLNKRCTQVHKIQVRAVKTRLQYLAKLRGGMEKVIADLQAAGKPMCVLGISGGADSTHTLLIALEAFDELGIPRSLLHCFTMPGFGTTSRTFNNAMKLMQLTGVTIHKVDIKARCLLAWQDEKKTPFGINVDGLSMEDFIDKLKDLPAGSQDLDFENKQARARTDVLMNAGFVLGTGTLTELAAGWCTFNADHMSMYSVNPGVAKTLIACLIRWYANVKATPEQKVVLDDIADTAESPELLPVGKDGEQAQKSNESIGPKDLRDFFLYNWVRWGSKPSKVLYLANQAPFKTEYSILGILACLRTFVWRFITQRFKHSCQPDGVKLGSVSLNPRYDCHLPSDTAPDAFVDELEAYAAKKPDEIDWTEPAKPTPAATDGNHDATANGGKQQGESMTTIAIVPGAIGAKVLRALLRVDIKNDFMPTGSLPVAGGDEIVPCVNQLSRSTIYDLVIDIEDDHGPKHGSFYTQHDGAKPFDDGVLYGVPQKFWTVHCVHGTKGAEFHPDLDRSMVARTFPKGQDDRVDSYSGFYDNGRSASAEVRALYDFLGKSTGLAEYLIAEADKIGADEIEVHVVGLAFRYCVSFTAKDARAETYKGKQFRVVIVEDGIRAITFAEGDYEREKADLEALGIEFKHSADVLPKIACAGETVATAGDTTELSAEDKAVAAFKAEFCTEGSLALDAWFDNGFIQVHINGLEMADRAEELAKIPAPGEYHGFPTVITLWAREVPEEAPADEPVVADEPVDESTAEGKAVAAFKKEFCTEGSIVLGAWFSNGFIQVHINPIGMDERQEELKKVPAPGEYMGFPTVITLFPRD